MTISVIIATAYRLPELERTLTALCSGTRRPDEVVVVNGAPECSIDEVIDRHRARGLRLVQQEHVPPSAAAQRNVGVRAATGDLLLFLDDDAYPETDAIEKLARVLEADQERHIGGTAPLIRNQLCHPPSPLSKRWLDFLSDTPEKNYSGRVVGPAIVIGPAPSPSGDIVPVEWLSSTCVLFRREAFPVDGFPSLFSGYSYMEDVDLSLRIARSWKLMAHTGAYIFHDSQPSRFKAPYVRARMIVTNRYYVMTRTLGRTTWLHHVKFFTSLVVDRVNAVRSIRRLKDGSDWALGCVGTFAGIAALARGPAAGPLRIHSPL